MARCIVFLLLIGCFTIPGHSRQQVDTDIYQAGKIKLDSGNWRGALNIWIRAAADTAAYVPDPRLGFEFIRLVTEHELQYLYKSASLLYTLGLTAEEVEPFENELKDELERLKPIVPDDIFKNWMQKFQAKDASIYADIRAFWISQDPTPLQLPNERLIEHWERIAYARKHYRKNTITAYDTDDRGIIYVRYGKPDRHREGIMVPDETEIRSKLTEMNSMNRQIRQSGLISMFTNEQYSNIRAQYQPMEYELWIYYLAGQQGTSTFLFGIPGDGGRFGLRKGLHEFVPRSAYRTGVTSPGDDQRGQIVNGDIIEIGLYRGLAAQDNFFMETLNDYERNWGQLMSGTMGAETFKNQSTSTLAQIAMQRNQELLRQSRSDYDRTFIPLDHATRAYRMIRNGKSGYLLINSTDPTLATALDFSTRTEEETSRSYALKDAYVLYTPSWKLSSFNEHTVPLTLEQEPFAIRTQNSAFWIEAPSSDGYHLRFTSELYRMADDFVYRREEHAQIVGTSNFHIPLEQALATEGFNISDIMLIDPSGIPSAELEPFRALPSNTLSQKDLLGMYFEAYNIPKNTAGSHDFTLTYTIREETRNRRRSSGTTEVTTTYSVPTPNTDEMLEIDVSALRPGTYSCEVHFYDGLKTITRRFQFTIRR